PIGFPVDLRPFHPGTRSTSTLSVAVDLHIPAGQPWQSTYEQLLTVLTERRGAVAAPPPGILRVPLPVLRLGIRWVARRARKRDRLAAAASVNNIGRFGPTAFSTPDFEASGMYVLGFREPASPVTIELVEFGGRTEMTLVWWDGAGMGE